MEGNQLKNRTKKKVLLVEDEKMIQVIHLMYLQELGCKVDIVDNGTKAVSQAKQKYDLIFMDVGLPDISGIEATRQIRKNGVTCKIVVLTAFIRADVKDECLTAGVNLVAAKPITPDKLSRIVRAC